MPSFSLSFASASPILQVNRLTNQQTVLVIQATQSNTHIPPYPYLSHYPSTSLTYLAIMSASPSSLKRKLDTSDQSPEQAESHSPKSPKGNHSNGEACTSAHCIHETDQSIRDRDEIIHRLTEDKKALQKTLASYRDVLDDKVTETSSLKLQKDDLEKQREKDVAEVIQEQEQMMDAIAELDEVFDSLRDADRQTIRDLARANQELTGAYPGSPAMVMPPKIQARWAKLATLIEAFVRRHFPLFPPSSHTDRPSHHHFHLLHTNPTDPVPDTNHAAYPFKAWIWHRLYTTVFAPASAFWAGDLGVGFAAQCGAILAAARDDARKLSEYHAWRSRTVNLLADVPTDYAARVAQATDDIVGFFRAAGLTVEDRSEEMVAEMEAIVIAAGDVDLLMRRAKAGYAVFYPAASASFDKETARLHCPQQEEFVVDHPWHEEMGVVLVVAPGVLKRGTTDGRMFGEEGVFVKSEVLCEEPRAAADEEEWVDGNGEQRYEDHEADEEEEHWEDAQEEIDESIRLTRVRSRGP